MSSTPNNPKKTKYYDSPVGVAHHPWLNKPDTKFDESGEFKVDLVLKGEPAIKFMEKVREAADAYHAECTTEMTPGERRKWSIYYPYEELEDDQGTKTGEVKFKFRQNALIRLRDGGTVDVKMMLADAEGNETAKPIFNGAILRTRYSMRGIKMTSAKQFGIRLDMAGAQVVKFGGSGGGQKGFSRMEDYDDADTGDTGGGGAPSGPIPSDSDY